MGTEPGSSIEDISREECLHLLGQHEVGRIGFVHGGRPEVLPVNYVLDGEGIVFRTAAGLKLAAVDGAPVAFEVDDVDRSRRSAWSVVVHGVAHEVGSLGREDLRERLGRVELAPWGGGDKPFLVRIAPLRFAGRRVGGAAPPPTMAPMFDYEEGAAFE